jgi:hypothetical protein
MGDPYARHPQSGSRRPVMVAPVEHVESARIGAHRTWLMVDGSAKASLDPVRISTDPIKGGAVRLASALETLMIGGDRDLSRRDGGDHSAGRVEALILPPIVEALIILADNDLNSRGEKAARTAAARWLAEHQRVSIAMPPSRNRLQLCCSTAPLRGVGRLVMSPRDGAARHGAAAVRRIVAGAMPVTVHDTWPEPDMRLVEDDCVPAPALDDDALPAGWAEWIAAEAVANMGTDVGNALARTNWES